MAIVYHNLTETNMSDILNNMALFIGQKDERTDLQRRIAMELQEKMKTRELETKSPDLVEDSQYIKGTKKTTTLTFAWVIIVIAVVVIAIWLIMTGMAK